MLRILDDWKPHSQDEESKRAYFFLHMIGAQCMSHVESILAEAQEIGAIPMPDVMRCTKLLVCISSSLAVLEQSDVKPFSWLSDWLLQVMTQLDEMIPDPPSSGMTEPLAKLDAEGMIKLATESTCLILTLRRSEFQAFIADLLIEDQAYRNELLVMALSQPTDALSDHLSLFS